MVTTKDKTDTKRLPMMPIRDVVIFPFMMTPFVVGRESSVRALEEALLGDKKILLATQHDASVDEPRPDEIYSVGTIANIVQSLKQPDGNIKVLVEGVERGKIISVSEEEGYFRAVVKTTSFKVDPGNQMDVLISRVTTLFEQYVKLSQNLNYETMIAAIRVDDPGKLADTVGANLQLTIEEKQELLEIFDPIDRLTRVAEMLDIEIEKLNVDRTIQGRVKRQMEKAQKEYYLNEKIKAIQKELGRGEKSEIDELKKRIETAGMTQDALDKAMAELKRLENMPPMSAESTVSRNYLDWLLAVPWKKRSKEIRDLKYAETVLEADHYGLEKIKERILEFLAVRRLVMNPKGSILCFVGPPGVGKTSLGMSIAKATGRKFVRMSLGGVRDEAEVRGHRRTYIGALPEKIIQMMKKAGTKNPVFMLDEIDKMSMDFRGDPSAALLEVLDPEQNNSFSDHYLEVTFDLSNVIFIATANMLDPIPPALLDRMEVLEIPGYTREEKLEIARRHLVPKQIAEHGLTDERIKLSDEALNSVIEQYTREAGVRNLEREIASVIRNIAVKVAENQPYDPNLVPATIADIRGPQQYYSEAAERTEIPGVSTGLAWTPTGGDILFIEVSAMAGKGSLILTGQLGDVMKESARAGLSWVRTHVEELAITVDFEKSDIHLHVPQGAVSKDGPSAGVAITVALVSLLTGRRVRGDVAMTGEITLRGTVLPVGGIKEKVLAAHRAGIKRVIMPERNGKDLVDVPDEIKRDIEIVLVKRVDETLAAVLEDPVLIDPTHLPGLPAQQPAPAQ